jgi:hypothetical protein
VSSSQGFVESAVEFGGDDVEVGLGKRGEVRIARERRWHARSVAICWGDQRCWSLAATTARSRSQVASFDALGGHAG